MTHKDIIKDLNKYKNSDRAKVNAWFFKTNPGQYGHGDKFIGISVPHIRKVAKSYTDISLLEITELLKSIYHEHRLCAVIILVNKYDKSNEKEKTKIYNFYIKNIQYINNWDIVDSSASQIVGKELLGKDKNLLYRYAKSTDLWKKRIAIISTFWFLKNKRSLDTYEIAKILLNDKHDLIHKAVGWMLREAGKNVSTKELEDFLHMYAPVMPRTMLRYSIEKFTKEERHYFMNLKR